MNFIHETRDVETIGNGELRVFTRRGERSNYDNGWAKSYTAENGSVRDIRGLRNVKSIDISSEIICSRANKNGDIITYSWTVTEYDDRQESGEFAVNRWIKYVVGDDSQQVTITYGNDQYSFMNFIYPDGIENILKTSKPE